MRWLPLESLFRKSKSNRARRNSGSRPFGLEELESRDAPAGVPAVTLSAPPDPLLGEQFAITLSFDNTHATDVGYGPYIDLYLPLTGADGAGAAIDDGIDFLSATYLGVPVTATEITLTAGGVAHPYAVDNTGAPIILFPPTGFEAGDKLVVLQLPFGSFTADQPPANITVNLQLSELADLNDPLRLQASAGFQFGGTPVSDPATDPTILGGAVFQDVAPALMRLTKTYVGPESETATGPNYTRQYVVSVDIANNQTLTNLDLTDALPGNLQFVSVISTLANGAPAATSAISTPSTSTPGGTLTRRFASVTGGLGANDAQLIFSYYVPLNDAASTPVINASSGDDNVSVDDARAQGSWTPIDSPRDNTQVAVSDVTTSDHTLNDRSLAIQKEVAIVTDTGTAGASPGDTLEYTLRFQISDYFAFQDLLITDLFSDGQDLLNGSFRLTLTDGHAGTLNSVLFGGSNVIHTANISGGSDQLVFRLSQELSDRAFSANGRLVGGAIPNGGTGGPTPPSAPPLPFGATEGFITFRTTIRDTFEIDFPSGDHSVDQGDRLTNNVTIQGNLLAVANLTTLTGQNEADTSQAQVVILSGQASKFLHAINGNTAFATNQVAPGDAVTYRLRYTLPTSDFENLLLEDFLPLPVLYAAEITTFDVAVGGVPAAGHARFSAGDTFHLLPGAPAPTITIDSVANSIRFDFGDYDNLANSASVLEILFTVTVSADVFADGLFLTNQLHVTEGTTNAGNFIRDAIVQIELTEPVLSITKAVVATSKPGATFTPGASAPAGVTFHAPGSATSFTGLINSNGLAATPIDSNLSGVDAGDLVTFAIIVENTGGGLRGAFDVRLRDLLPAGFIVPPVGAGLNLQVRDGTGALMTFTTVGGGLLDPLGGIGLDDPGPTNPDQGAIDRFDPLNGRNIAVITFDLQVAGSALPNANIDNTATLFNYAGAEGGPDHTTTDLTDDARVTTSNVAATKSIVATSEAFTPETGTGDLNDPRQAAIGEIVRYRLVIQIPEGTAPNFQIQELLPSGLTYIDGSARLALIANTAMSSTNPPGATLTLGLGNGPNGAGPFVGGAAVVTPTFVLPDANVGSDSSLTADPDVFGDGSDVFFKLGDLINNDRDPDAEFVVIEFNALVNNTASGSNDAGDNRDNSFQVRVGGTALTTSNVSRVRIAEPALTIQKDVTPTTGDAGDTVAFTVIVSNPGGANRTDAFNVRVLDTLPAFLTLSGGFTVTPSGAGVVGLVDNSSGSTLDLNIDNLQIGGSVTITFAATINSNVTPGQSITNNATMTYTSLPGVNGTAGNATGSDNTGSPGSDTGERTGSGVTPNDLNGQNDAVVTVNNLQLTKALVSTSEAGTSGADVAIGEIVRYRLAVRIPESNALTSFQLVDALPRGLIFLNDGTARVAFVSNNGGITSSTLSGAGLNQNGNSGSVTPTFLLDATFIAGGPTFLSGADPVFNLGDVVNDDRDNDAEFIVLEFNALVDNAGTTAATINNINETLVNTFTVNVAGGTSVGGISNSVTVTVREPQITNVNKTVSAATPDAGDTITYTVTFTNSGNATAYDVRLTDLLPAALTRTAAAPGVTFAGGAVVGIDTSNTSGNSVDVRFDSIAAGASVTVTYQAIVNSTVAPNDTIDSTATVRYTSLPGDRGNTTNVTGSETPGNSGDTNGERDGSGGPTDLRNNYVDSDSEPVTIPNGSIAKGLVATSAAHTAAPDVTIGEVITYSLTVTLAEGATPSLRVIDDLRPGLAFVPGTVTIDSASFGGTVSSTPTVTATGGSGDDLQLDFGSITVDPDNVAGNNSFIITFQAVVLDVATNRGVTPPGQTTLPNTATLQVGAGPTASSNTVNVRVVEPRMTIVKNIVQTRADAADTVTVTFTVQNTGSSAAFDVVVRDLLNTASFNASTVNFGTAGTDYPADFTPTIDTVTGELLFSGGRINDGATVTFTFTVALTSTVTPAQVINNTAQVTQATTLPGSVAGERSVTSPPSTDSLTINSNALSGFVYVDADNDATFDGGETGLTNIDVRLTGTDHLGNTVDVTIQTGAGGAYSFTGLRPGTYVISEPTQPAGFVDGRDTPGATFGGAAAPPTGDAISGIIIAAGSNTTGTNYNFGELPPASIANLVWIDSNGNGLQDTGELGRDGVTVQLSGTDDAGNTVTASTTTAGGGLYAFNNLRPGTYQVTFTAPAGFVFTFRDSAAATATDANDSDADRTTGQTAAFTLTAGQNDGSRDAGLFQRISIGDRVWYDFANLGAQDANEPGIEGATVTLQHAGADGIFGNADDLPDQTATTGANGSYSFADVDPGTQIRVLVSNLPGGFNTPTADLDGVGSPNQATFAGTSGNNRDDVDFGYRGTGRVGDFIWHDRNGDGVQDANEPGIPDVDVRLHWYGVNGNPGDGDDAEMFTTTDASGQYAFANLPAGTFSVEVITSTLPPNAVQTYDLDDLTGPAFATADSALVTLAAGATNNNVDFGYTGNASVGDAVWYDVDGNGAQNLGEPGIGGVTVTLVYGGVDNDLSTASDNLTYTTTTDVNGNYSFGNLFTNAVSGPSASYRVSTSNVPAIFTSRSFDLDGTGSPDQADLSLDNGQDRDDADFGYRGSSTLGNFVWDDADGNGRQGGTEPGIDNVTVQLFDSTGTIMLATTTTNVSGAYSFSGLAAGDYQVRFLTPAGYSPTAANFGADDTIDSDASVTTGFTGVITIATGAANVDVDAGYFRPISIGNFVWYDLDGDGNQDAGEPGIPGVTVTVTWLGPDGVAGGGNDVDFTGVTDGAGIYSIPGLPPGEYTVGVTTQPSGLTVPTAGPSTFTLTSGVDRDDIDFGFRGPGSIGDRLWYDVNLDGSDVGEPGLVGVTVTAVWFGFDGDELTTTDNITYTTTTVANGVYGFANLPLGGYRVAVVAATLPPDLVPTYDLDDGQSNPNNDTLVTVDAGDPLEDGADFGYTGQRFIGDRVWVDFDGDGNQDADEPGLSGVTVTLTWAGPDNDLSDATDNVVLTTMTGPDGVYGFSSIPPGLFEVAVTGGLPAGVTNTGDPDAVKDGVAQLTLGASDVVTTIDFGYQGNSSLSGFVYRDFSTDGIRQPAGVNPETGISGVTVTLTGTDVRGNSITRVASTGADGTYSFGGLLAGDYLVTETQPVSALVAGANGFYDGRDTVGTIGGVQTGTSPTKNQLAVTLATGNNGIEYNFGESPPADPFGFVYIDFDNDGIRDAGELGIAGVTITVSGTTAMGNPLTAADVPGGLTRVTDANGRWEFAIMPPGTYSFVETQPLAFDDGLEEDADPSGPPATVGNDRFDNVVLSPFPVRGPFNFGELAVNGELRGSVYADRSNNGFRDNAEVGLSGVTVFLTGVDIAGTTVNTRVVTDAAGNFAFTRLRPGTYQLSEAQPAGFLDGLDRAGTLGGAASNDLISSIVLGVNQVGTNYLFGEQGWMPGVVTKRNFLASSDSMALLSAAGAGLTIVNPIPGSPLLLAGAVGSNTTAWLSTAQLTGAVNDALTMLRSARADSSLLERLRQTSFQVADLPGAELGRAFANHLIVIDADAGGHGWSLDDIVDAGEVDLLSVIMHEIGHELDLEHGDAAFMAEFIGLGERRLPTADELDRYFRATLPHGW